MKQKIISVSMIHSTHQLFSGPAYDVESFISDATKHFTVFNSIIGHTLTCFEIPLGFYIMGLIC